MTLYTLESEKIKDIRTALIYLIISIFLMIAGAVYEHFSFGVYSNYIIYAFAIPLAGLSLPYMLRHMYGTKPGILGILDSDLYHAAVATLTVGSIVHGALAICGRPNSLTSIYPAAAVVLLIAGIITEYAKRKSDMHHAITDNAGHRSDEQA